MAMVKMTVQSIINLGLWEKLCDYKGWDYWILNEGRIDNDEVVEFDDEFKKNDIESTANRLDGLQEAISESDVKEWVIDESAKAIQKLKHYEAVLKALKDEWKDYTNHSSQACLVMDIVDKFENEDIN